MQGAVFTPFHLLTHRKSIDSPDDELSDTFIQVSEIGRFCGLYAD